MEALLQSIFSVVLYLKGYRVHQVHAAEEEAQNAFANKLMQEEGYAANYLELMPRYYANSAAFALYYHGALVGTMRLIDPSAGPCRILDFWNVQFPPSTPLHEYREMGALAIAKEHRGKSRWAMTALLHIANLYSKKQGIRWWFASAYADKFEKFKRMNPMCIELECDAPTAHHHTFRKRYASYFDVPEPVYIFAFNLKGASYAHQFQRTLFRKRHRPANNPPATPVGSLPSANA